MSTRIPCNLCGIDDATIVFAPGVAQISQIVRCNRCGLMYSSPRAKAPDHVEIASYDPDWGNATHDPQKHEKEQLQVKDYGRTRTLLNQLYPNRGKLLEIGSSLGFLLAVFKQDGWDVLGVEPRSFAARFTRETHGIETINSILEDAGVPDESVDVVLLNHVIEHVDDPLRTFREINRVLKPSGHFVIETPRYDTLMFKLLGRRERSINCEGHIYFFTTQTLRKLYEHAGFRLVALDYVGRSLTADRLMYNVGVVSKSQRVKRLVSGMSRGLRLHKLAMYVNLRDMQRVCVQKTASAASAQAVTSAVANAVST